MSEGMLEDDISGSTLSLQERWSRYHGLWLHDLQVDGLLVAGFAGLEGKGVPVPQAALCKGVGFSDSLHAAAP